MKLSIYDDENDKIYQIEISEYDMLNDVYGKLVNNKFLTLSDFFGKVLIYKNIIISGKRINCKHYGKIVKFYKINENDKIWFGKIGNYLTENDVIIEVYTSELGGEFIHLIMKKTDQISKIKLIVEKFIGKIVKIWKINGDEINDDEIIDNIDFDGKYYRVIIGFESNSEIFVDCCKYCEEYLMDHLLKQVLKVHDWDRFFNFNLKSFGRRFIDMFRKRLLSERDSFILWFYNYFDDEEYKIKKDEIAIDQCRLKIIEIKKEILSNAKYDYILPAVFINTRFLFCIHMMDIIGEIFNDFVKSIGFLLKMLLQFSVILYANEIRSQFGSNDKSMKTILMDIFDCFDNTLLYLDEDLEFWVKLFFNQFTFRISEFQDSEIDKFVYEFFHPEVASFRIRISEEYHKLYVKYPITISKMKKAISSKTGLQMKYFYFMNSRFDDKPKDEDEYHDDFCNIEFLRSIDEIKILHDLCKGAFGNAILCQSKSSGREFVLKKPLDGNDDLFREINIQYRFRFSKKLFNYLDLFDSNGKICFSMKFLSKGSLSLYLKENIVSEPQIAKWCHQLLIQINELHNQKIIHRDIKGDNILLDEDHNVYLIDFGISKRLSFVSSEDLQENLKAYINGTRRFMAPEYINNEEYSNKIDIWSFGATVIEMVSGEMPFSKMNSIQASLQISKTKVIKYKPRQRISNELKDFIDLCLTANKDERPSAEQLIQSQFISNYLNEIKQ